MTFEDWWSIPTEWPEDEKELARNAWDAGYSAGQFALNSQAGMAANEAEKDARRIKAIEQLGQLAWPTVEQVDAILKVAQG